MKLHCCSSGPPYSLFLFLLWLSSLPLPAISNLKSDQEALLDFASAVGHAASLNWQSTSSVCTSWRGVTCSTQTSSAPRVIALRLPGCGLVGPIPPNTVGRLDALLVLSLRSNSLNGSLPLDLLSLPSLRYLHLQHNYFSAHIPSFLSSTPLLINVIDLSFNSFTGTIPLAIQNLTYLTTLYLQNNSLSGTIPHLDLPNLKQLNLSNNHLNGSIPAPLHKFPTSSFSGNDMLCGGPLDTCPSAIPSPSPTPTPTPTPSPSLSPSKASFPVPYQPPPAASPEAGRSMMPFPPITPQVHNSNHDSSVSLRKGAIASIIIGSVGGAMGLLALASAVMACCCVMQKRKGLKEKGEMPKEGRSSHERQAETNKLTFCQGGKSRSHNNIYEFNLEELLMASAVVLGKGSYGTTYAATLEGGTRVVVKQLKDVVIGEGEFEQQMKAIGRRSQNHPNVIPLRAYYHSKNGKLLIYDCVSGGLSLSAKLHGSKGRPKTSTPLDWENRVKISLGVALGVAHIHSIGTWMTHGNIKSSNVVITREEEACVTDFGLTPIVGIMIPPDGRTGYLAPETIEIGKATHMSDVYSFGVLLLELLTGKPPIPLYQDESVSMLPPDLPKWVHETQRTGAEILDSHLINQRQLTNIGEEMAHMVKTALACLEYVPEMRPSMEDAVRMIAEIPSSRRR